MPPSPTQRHSRRVGAVIAALVLVASAASIPTSLATAHRAKHATPRLKLTHSDPVTVRGTGFKPRSRVRATLTASRTFVRRLTASRQGAFTVKFPTAVDSCTVWSVSATSPHQATVVLRGAKPECPPA
jgi:hypothetical protein